MVLALVVGVDGSHVLVPWNGDSRNIIVLIDHRVIDQAK